MTGSRCFALLTPIVAVAVSIGLTASAGDSQVLAHKKKMVGILTGPGDSPITIRGGSVVAHQGFSGEDASLACYPATANPPCQEVSGTYNDGVTTVELDRTVAVASTKPYMPVPLMLTPPATTEWMIALTFRTSAGKDSSGTGAAEVDICSKSDCTTNGTRNTPARTIYMYAPNPATGEFTSRTLESQILHYSVSYCDQSPGAGSICDHIYKIKLSPGFTVQGAATSAPTPLLCIDGACEITLKQ